MSTTHLIAINGDHLDRIREAPETFAMAVIDACRRNGDIPGSHALIEAFKAYHVASSMNGTRGAISEAWREYV